MGQVLNYQDCRELKREVENSNENKRLENWIIISLLQIAVAL